MTHYTVKLLISMMTSLVRNAFCITGPLWGESTVHGWIPIPKANSSDICCYTPTQRSWRGGILDSPCPSVRLSVRPSVCRRHGFRSISQVCFGISISNFICMSMVAIGRSLLICSDVTFKMAAWQPYWIFWFPDSNFLIWLWISTSNFSGTTLMYMGRSLLISSNVIFKMAAWQPY